VARKSDNSALTDPFLEKAHRRFRHALDYWTPHYQRALMAWEFCEGEQWDEGIKARRLKDKRPCLTIRRIKQPIRQISNEQRQNRRCSIRRSATMPTKCRPRSGRGCTGTSKSLRMRMWRATRRLNRRSAAASVITV
jgi:hypothetical protein